MILEVKYIVPFIFAGQVPSNGINPEADIFLGQIPLAPYGTPGTDEIDSEGRAALQHPNLRRLQDEARREIVQRSNAK